MTAINQPLEIVDLTDLGSFDDNTKHYFCQYCYPPPVRAGAYVQAACGRWYIVQTTRATGAICRGCAKVMMSESCPVCGHRD